MTTVHIIQSALEAIGVLLAAYAVDKEIDDWLDDLIVADRLDHKQLHRLRYRQKYSAAYRAEHRDEIAAKMAA